MYNQYKDGHVYKVMFPKEKIINDSTHSLEYRFAATGSGNIPTKYFVISLSEALCAQRDKFERSVLTARKFYELLGTDLSSGGLATGDADTYLALEEKNQEQLQYLIAKYSLDRFGIKFEEKFLLWEFISAIRADVEELYRQLIYFDIHRYLLFPNSLRNISPRPQLRELLSIEIDFNVSAKSELENLVKVFENKNKTTGSSSSTSPKAFLSYSTKDKTLAGSVKEELVQAGIDVFLAHEDIEPSEEWIKIIQQNLDNCDAFLILLTDNFKSSSWTDQESGQAYLNDKLIIPIKVSLNPYGFLGKIQAVTLDREEIDFACRKIIDIIKHKFILTR